MSEWQPIVEHDGSHDTVLRVHVIHGVMAVRKNRAGQAFMPKNADWICSAYTTGWTEESFTPYFMKSPEFKKPS